VSTRGFFRRRFRRRARADAVAPAAALVAGRGLGDPPAAGVADDAELDTLRGELVRELDRMASDGQGGSEAFRRS
jgi:hypothetical protein